VSHNVEDLNAARMAGCRIDAIQKGKI